MQLGELQHQIRRFESRGVEVVAVSVDRPTESLAMIDRLGLSFELGADPDQALIREFGVQNPDTQELAIHAVYLIAESGEIFYRKVGLRRPVSAELIDAVDYFQGEYPRTDEAIEPRQRVAVAYPRNDFQMLATIGRVDALPATIDRGEFARVLEHARSGSSDDALVAFKTLMAASSDAAAEDLTATAAWLVRQRFFGDRADVLKAAEDLARRLDRISALEAELANARSAESADAEDAALHALARARAGLTLARANISKNAQAWNLRYAKSSLRGYREVALASRR